MMNLQDLEYIGSYLKTEIEQLKKKENYQLILLSLHLSKRKILIQLITWK